MRIRDGLYCLLLVSGPAFAAEPQVPQNGTQTVDVDVCVYTATPSGILAARAIAREGRSVLIVEPSRWVGGVLGAGLRPTQDCPNSNAVGGMARELVPSLGSVDHPTFDSRHARTISPKTIRDDFQKILTAESLRVIFDHRCGNVRKSGTTIQSVRFDLAPFDELGCPVPEPAKKGNLLVRAKMFIDASYEGDLMAAAGVSFRLGREAESEFHEPAAGVQPPQELTPISPFLDPADPESGLLKWVEHDHGKPIGAADGYTQAYNYRYFTTTDPEHRAPIMPPPGYQPQDFELVGRYVAWLAETIASPVQLRERLVRIYPGWMNSGEWNYRRESLFSMAPVGISQIYAGGDAVAHARIWKEHQNYLRGLHTFMSNDPRVPESYRHEVAEIGLDLRHHPETQGWPHQLYIRVARRLKGRYTMTAHDVYNKTVIDDPIGLAQYGIDTYPARRIWIEQQGKILVGIEGKMFVGGAKGPTNIPYPISYRAMTPRSEECTNLLVPVCFSATHLGYASARMEPVFMICGESAGIAACHALSEQTSVQEIDLSKYLNRLKEVGQKLTWDPSVDKPSNHQPIYSGAAAYSFQNLLKQADRDGNGFVSKAEWSAAKSSWEWLFPAIDTSHDEQIDASEYAAFQKYKSEHSDWRTRLSVKAEASQ